MGKKGLSVYRWTVFLPSMNHFPPALLAALGKNVV